MNRFASTLPAVTLLLLSFLVVVTGCENPAASDDDGTSGLPRILMNNEELRDGVLAVAVGSNVTVELQGSSDTVTLYYTLDGTDPTLRSFTYSRPLSLSLLEADTVIKVAEENSRTGELSAIATAQILILDSLWYRIDTDGRNGETQEGEIVQVVISQPGRNPFDASENVGLVEYQALFPVPVGNRDSWILGYRDRAIFGDSDGTADPITHVIATWRHDTNGRGGTNDEWNSQLWLRLKETSGGYELVGEEDAGGDTDAGTATRFIVPDGSENNSATIESTDLEVATESSLVANRIGDPIRVSFSGPIDDDPSRTVTGTIFVRREATTPRNLGSDRSPVDLTPELNEGNVAYGMTGPRGGSSFYRITDFEEAETVSLTVTLGLQSGTNNATETPGLPNAVTFVSDQWENGNDDNGTITPGDNGSDTKTFELTPIDGEVVFSITSIDGASYTITIVLPER